MNSKYMFSWIVYTVAVIDGVLISIFFYRLSFLSEHELDASLHIDFSYWIDYLGWMFFIFLGIYIHYARLDFANEFARTFNKSNQLQSKIAIVVFCDILPLALLITFLIRSSNWLLSNSGPGG